MRCIALGVIQLLTHLPMRGFAQAYESISHLLGLEPLRSFSEANAACVACPLNIASHDQQYHQTIAWIRLGLS